MARSSIERRLTEVGGELKQVRADLAVAEEQLAHFTDEAEDARLRALVSETPLADRVHRDARRHAEVMDAHRSQLLADIVRLEKAQDDLLDELLERRDRA